MIAETEKNIGSFRAGWNKFWGIETTINISDNFLTKENSVKDIVKDVLGKKGTYVSMAPRSNKYFIVNLSIDIKILIDGADQSISANIEGCNHTWNFREKFIEDLITITIDWIEDDRDVMMNEYFKNDLTIMTKIKNAIATADAREIVK